MAGYDEQDFEGVRTRWLLGLCPCCGGEICDWEWRNIVHEPAPIAEGVTLCGRCIGNEHHLTPNFTRRMLKGLLPV